MAASAFHVRFPFWALNPGYKSTAVLRWGALCKYRLSRIEQEPLAIKPAANLEYVTMAAREHWLLLRESFLSMHRTWATLPRLTVISDGSWEEAEFHRAFNFWPYPITVRGRESLIAATSGLYGGLLYRLAASHPLGLKLAAILLLAAKQRILFVDSDILWFSDPAPLLARHKNSTGPWLSVEKGTSYNTALLRRHRENALPLPALNSGCVWLQGDACPGELMKAMLETALEDPTHNFNEQTILALAASRHGGAFPREFCLVEFDDAMTIHQRQPWREHMHARHYVNWMRHQFYRDALKTRHQALVS